MIEFIKSKLRYKIMFFLSILIACSSFITMYIVTENIKKTNIHTTQKSLSMLNESIFQSLRSAMNTGNTLLIKEAEENARKIDGVKNLTVAKSEALIALYSPKESFTKDSEIQKAFQTKETSVIEYNQESHDMRMIRPMIATAECLTCHVNQKEGDVIGVIDLTFSLLEADNELYETLLNVFIVSTILGFITIFTTFLTLKKSTKPIDILEDGMRKLIDGDGQDKIIVNSSDEIGVVSNYFNLYIQKIQDGVLEDRILINEAGDIIERVKHGIYDTTIESETSNKSLEEFKTNVNKMILETNKHLTNINTILHQYSEYNYDTQVKLQNIDSDCVLSNLVENINSVRDSIISQNSYVDRYVILSRTDLDGNITYASQAFCDISGYTQSELLGKPHSIVRHEDMPKEVFKEFWETIKMGLIWQGEIKNKTKSGDAYWTFSTVGPTYNGRGILIGYTSTRQDITQQKYAQILNQKVTDILNNANDGFLTFDCEFKIQDGYSKRTLEILSQENLYHKNITQILFSEDIEQAELFEYGIKMILETTDQNEQELLISLLPNENTIKETTFLIHYKIINKNEFMLILEDVTKRKELEEAILYENKIQKMIVLIATRKYEFLELKDDFLLFLNSLEEKVNFTLSLDENLLLVTQVLHTFKGLFAQEELVNITQEIHNFESLLIERVKNGDFNNTKLHYMLTNNQLHDALLKDLHFISEILGDEFLEKNDIITINEPNFKTFEDQMVDTLDKNHINKNDFKQLVNDFLNLNQKPLKQMLRIYPKMVKNMSKSLNKEIKEIEIIGDSDILVHGVFDEFIKSLVHVFRNMIDHGIEEPQERLNLGKEMQGSIKCSFKMIEGDKIELIISDNGKGIDVQKIATLALEKNLITHEELASLSYDEKLGLIFLDNISTKEESSIISGRGIGLNAVKYELDKIEGKVKIVSSEGIGTKFIFELPRKLDHIKYEQNNQEELSNCIAEATREYFKNTVGITILEEQKDDNFLFLNHYSTIKLSHEKEILTIVSCDNLFLRKLIQQYVSQEELNDELFEAYANDTINETLNTILGHTVETLPYEFRNMKMSPPLNLDTDLLDRIIRNNEHITKRYVTSFGSFYSVSIFLNKITNILGE